MDGSRFDIWTRRRFGLAAGGMTASLAALVGFGAEAKKKRKKKKKCKKLGVGCNPGSKKKKCCKGLACEPPPVIGGNRCCLVDGQPCTDLEDCCSSICLDGECQPDDCKTLGQACGVNADCCSGFCDTGGSGQCELP